MNKKNVKKIIIWLSTIWMYAVMLCVFVLLLQCNINGLKNGSYSVTIVNNLWYEAWPELIIHTITLFAMWTILMEKNKSILFIFKKKKVKS